MWRDRIWPCLPKIPPSVSVKRLPASQPVGFPADRRANSCAIPGSAAGKDLAAANDVTRSLAACGSHDGNRRKQRLLNVAHSNGAANSPDPGALQRSFEAIPGVLRAVHETPPGMRRGTGLLTTPPGRDLACVTGRGRGRRAFPPLSQRAPRPPARPSPPFPRPPAARLLIGCRGRKLCWCFFRSFPPWAAAELVTKVENARAEALVVLRDGGSCSRICNVPAVRDFPHLCCLSYYSFLG